MPKLSKRHFYNGQDYDLDLEKKVLILKEDHHNKLLNKKLWNKFGFKKIGGSSVGDVLETDNFKSPFAAFANISWLGLPVLDRKYVDAGIAIEPIVISALEKVMKLKIETYRPEDYEYDYFKEIDEIIGGIPDGYLKEKNIILEIKTSSRKNYDSWNSYGVPISYLKQAQLYSYLKNADEFWIVATFLNEEDYLDPQNYPINKRILKNYRYKINRAQVEDDISKIKKWYTHYTKTGISPEFNLKKDNDLIEYLLCRNIDEYKQLLEKWKKDGKLKLEYDW